jgi:hypothetical protein
LGQAAALVQAGADQGGAEALVLEFREYGDGSQAEASRFRRLDGTWIGECSVDWPFWSRGARGTYRRSRLPGGTWIGECGVDWPFWSRGARGTYFCWAEKDMADDLTFEFGNERDGRLAALDEQGHEAGFQVSWKGGPVNRVDRKDVSGCDLSDARETREIRTPASMISPGLR